MNLSTNLRAAAAHYAAKPALIAGDRVLNYDELDKAAMDLARRFLAEGLVQGDRVAVHGPNTIEVVIAILACHHAGLVVVPVNTRLKPAEIRYVLDHSRPRLCYCDPQFEAGVKAVQPEIPGLTSIYTELPPGVQGADPAALSSHAPALILYTSGTTARPKGVTHSQRTLMESAQTMFGTGFDESTVTVVTMSLMHTAGLCGSLLPTLLKGGTVVLLAKFDAGELLDLVERWKCTWTLILPSVMQFVAAEQERRPRNLSSMRTWLSGGDSVSVSLQQRWARLCGQPLTEGYGMSESLMISFNPASAIRPGSIGLPAAKVQVRVLDLDGTPMADGSIGEIAVRSPANFTGYWKDPESTARTLADGWLLTGDLARFDADGYLWFEGRKKELIIRGGSNVSPREVEEVLYQHPAVMEVGVVGIPDEVYGERVLAFVVLGEGRSVAESELYEFARERLADYKLPERIAFLDVLPKGLTGKVQRRVLKDLAREVCTT